MFPPLVLLRTIEQTLRIAGQAWHVIICQRLTAIVSTISVVLGNDGRPNLDRRHDKFADARRALSRRIAQGVVERREDKCKQEGARAYVKGMGTGRCALEF